MSPGQRHPTALAAMMVTFPTCAVPYENPIWILNNANEARVTEKIKF